MSIRSLEKNGQLPHGDGPLTLWHGRVVFLVQSKTNKSGINREDMNYQGEELRAHLNAYIRVRDEAARPRRINTSPHRGWALDHSRSDQADRAQ